MPDSWARKKLEDYARQQQAKTSELELLLPQLSSAEIFSLDFRDTVYANREKPKGYKAEDYFRERRIVGNVEIDQLKAKALLEQTLIGLGEEGMYWMCFDPRHGLRAVFGSRVIDFLICFDCGSLYIYDGDSITECSTSGRGAGLFNRILQANEIPIVP